ncbi:MAG: AAA family ATPase [Saprospiraceae bacterium]|nr:AAA family ATPase [Saprospiraceae bacterium]
MISARPYIKSVFFQDEETKNKSGYPYDIPAIRQCEEIRFHADVTFFIGENGSGKSTLLEAMAIAYGFNPEGGTKSAQFEVHNTHSELHKEIKLSKSFKMPGDAYFMRAESFYNVATKAEEFGVLKSYGGKSLHAQSHGEAFLATLMHKLTGNGLYLLDEPEAALSPARQLTALSLIHQLVQQDSQFIIATHSPIIMAYPNATIYEFSKDGIRQIDYEETDHYLITKSFLDNPDISLKLLMENEDE